VKTIEVVVIHKRQQYNIIVVFVVVAVIYINVVVDVTLFFNGTKNFDLFH